MKKIILSLIVALTTTGAMAQITPTPNGDKTQWTFGMPAYDVEITTELWYKLDEAADNRSLSDKTNVFLKRTLQAGGWNTFCAPFAIANPASVFGEGVQVKKLSTASISGNTLTLNFDDASGIDAGKPYLIKLNGEDSVNLAADGKEFAGVTQNYTAVPTTITGVVSFRPVLVPESLTANDRTKLYLGENDNLYWPDADVTVHAFRAYFVVDLGASAAPELRIVTNFNGATGVAEVRGQMSDVRGEKFLLNQFIYIRRGDAIYDLQGHKVSTINQ